MVSAVFLPSGCVLKSSCACQCLKQKKLLGHKACSWPLLSWTFALWTPSGGCFSVVRFTPFFPPLLPVSSFLGGTEKLLSNLGRSKPSGNSGFSFLEFQSKLWWSGEASTGVFRTFLDCFHCIQLRTWNTHSLITVCTDLLVICVWCKAVLICELLNCFWTGCRFFTSK